MAFAAKVLVDIHTEKFRVYTISTLEELTEVWKLRQRCFSRYQLGVETAELFDLHADHLVVRSHLTGELCGVYRLASSQFCESFETAEDFPLESILATPGIKVELGWACIHPGERHGGVIALLWRGLAEYIRQVRPTLLWGETSLFESEWSKLGKIRENLYEIKNGKGPSRSLPQLMRAYLRAGAEVWPEPILDTRMMCYDFMTILDLRRCHRQIENHFGLLALE